MSLTTAGKFRRGIRIGIDVGSVRIGVARTDPEGVLAVPVGTVARSTSSSQGKDLLELAAIVAEFEPIEIVVGLPLGLDGVEGAAALAVRSFVQELGEQLVASAVYVPIRLVDERMSTAQATRSLQSAGRNSKQGRSVIDQAAAIVIVQHAIDSERSTGLPPGSIVELTGPTVTEIDRTSDDKKDSA